jgi:hypothetical protein
MLRSNFTFVHKGALTKLVNQNSFTREQVPSLKMREGLGWKDGVRMSPLSHYIESSFKNWSKMWWMRLNLIETVSLMLRQGKGLLKRDGNYFINGRETGWMFCNFNNVVGSFCWSASRNSSINTKSNHKIFQYKNGTSSEVLLQVLSKLSKNIKKWIINEVEDMLTLMTKYFQYVPGRIYKTETR